MTIEIHEPRLEALIQQRMDSGLYRDPEDVLLQALTSSEDQNAAEPLDPPRGTLDDVFAKVRGLADDLDFSRDRSPGRVIDLS